MGNVYEHIDVIVGIVYGGEYSRLTSIQRVHVVMFMNALPLKITKYKAMVL